MTKVMTYRANFTPLTLAISLSLLLNGCAIPNIQTKAANVALPAQYNQTLSTKTPSIQELANKEQSAKSLSTQTAPTKPATIHWNEWFNDPQLIALIDYAVANNQEVAVLLQRINMAANEVYAREGEYLPRVSAGVAVETEKVGEYTRNGATEQQLHIRDDKAFPDPLTNLKAGLTASWELDIWHKLRDSANVASLEYLASVEHRKFFVTQLVAEVSRTYYELLALDNQLANLDDTIAVQQNALNTLKQLKIYGRSSSLPITRFQAEVSKNASERFLIQQDIQKTENKLNLLLGRAPQPIKRQAEPFMDTSLHTPTVGVPSELLQNRADIRQAELELNAAELNIQIAKANFYPSFTLRAGMGLESFDPRYLVDVPESLAYSLSGDMFAPLINRRAIEATYQNASSQQIQAAYDYEYTVVRAVSEVSTRLTALDNLAQSYALKSAQIQSLEQSIDVANKLFISARGEYLEVLLAQREALEARGELINTRKQQLTALVELYQALGGGWQHSSQTNSVVASQAIAESSVLIESKGIAKR